MIEVVERLTSIWRQGGKIVFLGVGNPLRADDSVGLVITDRLQSALPAASGVETRFLLGESAPENFSGTIREFDPDHLIIFDAADVGKAPGSMVLIERDEIGGASFSTHILPLKILVDYLVDATGCTVTVIGVQPKLLEFAYPITAPVQKAAEQFVEEVVKAIA